MSEVTQPPRSILRAPRIVQAQQRTAAQIRGWLTNPRNLRKVVLPVVKHQPLQPRQAPSLPPPSLPGSVHREHDKHHEHKTALKISNRQDVIGIDNDDEFEFGDDEPTIAEPTRNFAQPVVVVGGADNDRRGSVHREDKPMDGLHLKRYRYSAPAAGIAEPCRLPSSSLSTHPSQRTRKRKISAAKSIYLQGPSIAEQDDFRSASDDSDYDDAKMPSSANKVHNVGGGGGVSPHAVARLLAQSNPLSVDQQDWKANKSGHLSIVASSKEANVSVPSSTNKVLNLEAGVSQFAAASVLVQPNPLSAEQQAWRANKGNHLSNVASSREVTASVSSSANKVHNWGVGVSPPAAASVLIQPNSSSAEKQVWGANIGRHLPNVASSEEGTTSVSSSTNKVHNLGVGINPPVAVSVLIQPNLSSATKQNWRANIGSHLPNAALSKDVTASVSSSSASKMHNLGVGVSPPAAASVLIQPNSSSAEKQARGANIGRHVPKVASLKDVKASVSSSVNKVHNLGVRPPAAASALVQPNISSAEQQDWRASMGRHLPNVALSKEVTASVRSSANKVHNWGVGVSPPVAASVFIRQNPSSEAKHDWGASMGRHLPNVPSSKKVMASVHNLGVRVSPPVAASVLIQSNSSSAEKQARGANIGRHLPNVVELSGHQSTSPLVSISALVEPGPTYSRTNNNEHLQSIPVAISKKPTAPGGSARPVDVNSVLPQQQHRPILAQQQNLGMNSDVRPKTTVTKSEKGSKGGAKLPAKEIESGRPTQPLEGGWPEGWVYRMFERQSGASKGHRDLYWYSPVKNYRLRSIVEVRKFLECLRTFQGDEEAAWRHFRQKP